MKSKTVYALVAVMPHETKEVVSVHTTQQKAENAKARHVEARKEHDKLKRGPKYMSLYQNKPGFILKKKYEWAPYSEFEITPTTIS
jgi:ribonuclease D